jgi:hypothetical protein
MTILTQVHKFKCTNKPSSALRKSFLFKRNFCHTERLIQIPAADYIGGNKLTRS